jgi:hypothetical protein
VTDDFDPERLFESLRDSTRRAAVTPAAEVRRRGHQRAVRARVVYATTAVVVLTTGVGAAFAAGQKSADHTIGPGDRTPSVTASATTAPPSTTTTPLASTPGPSPVRTSSQSAPVGGAASIVATTAVAPASSDAPASSAPVTVVTTASAPAAAPHLQVDLYRTPVAATTFSYYITMSGMLYQTYDFTTGDPLSGTEVPIGGMDVSLDGQLFDGADGGDVQCHDSPPLTAASLKTQPRSLTVKPGRHTIVITVRGACGKLRNALAPRFTRTVTFTVH